MGYELAGTVRPEYARMTPRATIFKTINHIAHRQLISVSVQTGECLKYERP